MEEYAIHKFYENVGERIRIARERKGLKQDALGKMLNLSRVSIVNIEKGRQRPSIFVLFEIAKITNVEITELFPSTEQTLDLEKSLLKESWEILIKESSGGNRDIQEKLSDFIKKV